MADPRPGPETVPGAPELKTIGGTIVIPTAKLGTFVDFTESDGRLHLALVVLVHLNPTGHANLLVFGKSLGDDPCWIREDVRFNPNPQMFSTWRPLTGA